MGIINFFKKERVNKGRLANLDFLKAISVVCMVLCHAVIFLYFDEESFAFVMGNEILGSILGVAHAFMFIMGVGLVFGRRNSPKQIFFRGLKMFILGYVLNFFRFAIYYLFMGYMEYFWEYFLSTDILPFVGVALMLTALFKKLRVPNIFILLFSIVLSITAPLFYQLQTGNIIIDSLLSVLVPLGNEDAIGFSLFSWYIFVAFGMVFADIVSRIKNLDKFYLILLIPSAVLTVGYIFYYFLAPYGCFANEMYYYGCSFVNAFGLICIDMFLISVFHFISKKIDINKLKIIPFLSKNITVVYVIHWLILGPIVFGIYRSEKAETGLKWYHAYFIGLLLLITSMAVAKLYLFIKNKIKEKKSVVQSN